MADRLSPEDAALIDKSHHEFMSVLYDVHDRCDDKWLQCFLMQTIGDLERCKESLRWINKPPFPHEP